MANGFDAYDNRTDVLPEKKRDEPGETARLQVPMPFREATTLVVGAVAGAAPTHAAGPQRRSAADRARRGAGL